MRQHRSKLALLFLETHHYAAYLDAESKRVGEELDAAFAQLVRGWQAEGEVRGGDPEVLVALSYGAFVGAARQRNERGRPLTLRLYDDTIEAAWALFAAPTKGES